MGRLLPIWAMVVPGFRRELPGNRRRPPFLKERDNVVVL